MKKEKILSRAAVIPYVLMIVAGLLLAGGMLGVWIRDGAGEEGLAAGILAVLTVILTALGVLYAVVAVFPLVFRLLYLRKPKRIFPILCLPTDVIFTAFNAAILVSVIVDGGLAEIGTLLIACVLFLISLAGLSLSIATLALQRKREKISE
jgi:hypothetical protein